VTESGETKPRKAPLRRPGVLRFSGVELLASLVLAIVATPFIESLKYGGVIEPLLMTVVLFLAVLAVGGNRKTLIIAICLVVPAVIGRWITHLMPKLVSGEIHWVAELVFLGFVVGQLFRFIMRAPRVNAEVLCAGISGYLLLAMIWIVAYRLVAQAIPDAFLISAGPPSHRTMDAFTAFYFSFATITTIGYGEIVPVANVARMLAVMEAVTGMFYMAIVISRLVALYTTNPPQPAPGDHPPPAT
jgi:hypothetical protein